MINISGFYGEYLPNYVNIASVVMSKLGDLEMVAVFSNKYLTFGENKSAY